MNSKKFPKKKSKKFSHVWNRVPKIYANIVSFIFQKLGEIIFAECKKKSKKFI